MPFDHVRRSFPDMHAMATTHHHPAAWMALAWTWQLSKLDEAAGCRSPALRSTLLGVPRGPGCRDVLQSEDRRVHHLRADSAAGGLGRRRQSPAGNLDAAV
jgi:hypothetical protein